MIKLRKKLICIMIVKLCAPSLTSVSESQKKLQIITWKSARYVSLHDLTRVLNIDSSFDVITQRGKLYRKTSVGIYQVDYSVAVINGKIVRDHHPIIRKEGEVFIPEKIAQELIKNLFPELKINNENESLVLEKDDLISDKQVPKKDQIDEAIAFVVIDPGHGGKDPGAISYGIMEKNITLDVSRYLLEFLRKRTKGIQLKLTRKGDVFVELSKRTEIANKMLKSKKNGIFISIHVNASLSSKIAGFETYYLSATPTNEEARTTATLENNVIVMETKRNRKKYDDVEYIEALMLNSQIQKESILLAHYVQKNLEKVVDDKASRGVKRADFYVLRGSLMPAILVEIGYITNPKEAKKLQQKDYQKKIAVGVGRGIAQFIQDYNEKGFSFELRNFNN